MQKKRIIITGATGLVGRTLSARLISAGHDIVVLSRSPDSARQKAPGAAEYLEWDSQKPSPGDKAVDGADAVISLAGEPLFQGKLTQKKYEMAMRTRILGVRSLVSAMTAAEKRPGRFLVGSSVGIYGFEGPDDEIVTERTVAGSDYHATSNAVWEHAASSASWIGIRTAYLRTGIVWGKDAGMAFKQLDQFKRGWGGVIGEGLNWLPWIHIDDEVGIIQFLLEHDDLEGPFNLSAPESVQYRDYARFLGEIAGKPVKQKTSEWYIRVTMGMAADMVIHNRRMVPARILEAGYKFQHPEARETLMNLFPKSEGR
jgi:uncharacterized protein (TIGR01777 family)